MRRRWVGLSCPVGDPFIFGFAAAGLGASLVGYGATLGCRC